MTPLNNMGPSAAPTCSSVVNPVTCRPGSGRPTPPQTTYSGSAERRQPDRGNGYSQERSPGASQPARWHWQHEHWPRCSSRWQRHLHGIALVPRCAWVRSASSVAASHFPAYHHRRHPGVSWRAPPCTRKTLHNSRTTIAMCRLACLPHCLSTAQVCNAMHTSACCRGCRADGGADAEHTG